MKNNKNYIITGDTLLCSQFISLEQPVLQSSDKPQTNTQNDNEDKEQEKGWVKKHFRVLSENVFFADTILVDYTKEGVLKNSLGLFPQKLSMFKDHRLSVDFLVGFASEFKYKKVGTAGIDSLFNIDRLIDPKLARNVETGAAQAASLTLKTKFEKSHDMKDADFWHNLGKEVDGSLVRFIALEILKYYEVSLVWAGSDPTAVSQKLEHYSNQDAKKIYLSPGKEENKMDEKELFQMIKQTFGSSIVTIEQAKKAMVNLKTENTDLKTQITTLENQVSQLKPHEALNEKVMLTLRENIQRLTKLTGNMSISTLQQKVINEATYDELLTMQKESKEQADKLLPLICTKCGGTNVERRSSVDTAIDSTTAPAAKFKKI